MSRAQKLPRARSANQTGSLTEPRHLLGGHEGETARAARVRIAPADHHGDSAGRLRNRHCTDTAHQSYCKAAEGVALGSAQRRSPLTPNAHLPRCTCSTAPASGVPSSVVLRRGSHARGSSAECGTSRRRGVVGGRAPPKAAGRYVIVPVRPAMRQEVWNQSSPGCTNLPTA